MAAFSETHLVLADVVIRDTRPREHDQTLGRGLDALEGATVYGNRVLLAGNPSGGVALFGPDTTARFTNLAIRETACDTGLAAFGHGLTAVEGAAAVLERAEVSQSCGVGLFFAHGAGVVSASVVSDNTIGIHVQDTSTLVEAASAPDAPTAQQVIVTRDTTFVDNGSRVGSGVLSLPSHAQLAADDV